MKIIPMDINFYVPAKRSFLVSLLILSTIFSGTSQVQLIMESTFDDNAELVSVDVKANGWQNIVSAQFSIQFDPAFIAYQNAGNFQVAHLGSQSIGSYFAAEGTLILVWYDFDPGGESLPEGGTLFTLYFKPLLPGNTVVEINNIPRPIEIRGTNGAIQETTSNPVELMLEMSTSTKETSILNNKTVNCYPNPASEQLIFDLRDFSTEEVDHQLQVFDPEGRVITKKSFSGNTTTLSLNILNEGLYYFKILNAENIRGIGSFSVIR